MRNLIIFLIIFSSIGSKAQEKEELGSFNSENSFLNYDGSDLQLKGDFLHQNGLYDGMYNLESFISGLYLKPENYQLISPTSFTYGGGYLFRYNIKNSNFYLLAGPEITIYGDISGQRIYNYGFGAGLGHEVTDKLSLEARYFQNLNSSQQSGLDVFQPLQMNTLSLGLKTSF